MSTEKEAPPASEEKPPTERQLALKYYKKEFRRERRRCLRCFWPLLIAIIVGLRHPGPVLALFDDIVMIPTACLTPTFFVKFAIRRKKYLKVKRQPETPIPVPAAPATTVA